MTDIVLAIAERTVTRIVDCIHLKQWCRSELAMLESLDKEDPSSYDPSEYASRIDNCRKVLDEIDYEADYLHSLRGELSALKTDDGRPHIFVIGGLTADGRELTLREFITQCLTDNVVDRAWLESERERLIGPATNQE